MSSDLFNFISRDRGDLSDSKKLLGVSGVGLRDTGVNRSVEVISDGDGNKGSRAGYVRRGNDERSISGDMSVRRVRSAGKRSSFISFSGRKSDSSRYYGGSVSFGGVGTDVDDFDVNGMMVHAESIIERLNMNSIQFSKLSKYERRVLALYFYSTNTVLRRVVDLKTSLPLSTMTIIKPDVDNQILQDYIYNFYKSMLDRLDWKRFIWDCVVRYWIFSEVQALVEDDFGIEKNVDIDDSILKEKINSLPKDKVDRIKELTDKYNLDIKSLSLDEKLSVVNALVPNYNSNYTGVKRVRVIDFSDIVGYSVNKDIDFCVYNLSKSPSLGVLNGISMDDTDDASKNLIKDLLSLGYTRSYLLSHLRSDGETFEVTNDVYTNEGLYIAEFTQGSIGDIENSYLTSLLNDLILLYNVKKRERELVLNANKKVILLSAGDDVSEDMLSTLEDNIMSIISSSSDVNGIVTTNFDVSVENLDLLLPTNQDSDSLRDIAEKNILIGSGVPDGIVSGEDSYGGSYLKLEVMTEEFSAFQKEIKSFIEDRIFKPVAIKRGFVTYDDFGNVIPVYPQVNFEIRAITNSSEFKRQIADMVNDGLLPVEDLYKAYGYDPEETWNALVKEKEEMKKRGLSED